MKPLHCAVLAALALLAGCSGELRRSIVPRQAPEVTVRHELLAGADGSVLHHVTWSAARAGGEVDHYVYAVDPVDPGRVDATWIRTRDTQRLLRFPVEAGAAVHGVAGRMHVLAVRAVDRRGAMSEPALLALSELSNVPPSVQIISPVPSHLLTPIVPPSLVIRWSGVDPDGSSGLPVRYVYRLFTQSDPEFTYGIQNPDSLRRAYAPDFDGWTSVPAESMQVAYSNLTLDGQYLFVITAFDEAGDYDPLFSLNHNMLRFRIGYASSAGPRLTFFNEYFSHAFPSGGFSKDPARLVPVQGPANAPITYHWYAEPLPGTDLVGYRWALDPEVLDDETPRSGPDDLSRWSDWSLTTTSATIGPFAGYPKDETHRLYVEVRDNVGWVTLSGLEITVRGGAMFYKPLLIVDDTRLTPDRVLGGVIAPPVGRWPTAAEADTFLYARGGFPWKGYPAGTLSGPGIFDGYEFDTLGTRTGAGDLTVPYSILSQYRHVIWLTDLQAASFTNAGYDIVDPMTSLRYMCSPGHVNTLGMYASAGGKVWLAGGGAATASLLPYNWPLNDVPGYRFTTEWPGEFGPGRLVYDRFGWRSGVHSLRAGATVIRFTGRFGDSAATSGSGSPYAGNPPFIRAKTPATDPLPPLRTSSDFYQNQFDLEYLYRPNVPDLGFPALDSLYIVKGTVLTGATSNPHNVAMTVVSAPGSPFVLTGFNLWNFVRADCADLVDFVLGDLWGMMRNPPAARAGRLVLPEGAAVPRVSAPAAGARGADGSVRAGRRAAFEGRSAGTPTRLP